MRVTLIFLGEILAIPAEPDASRPMAFTVPAIG